MAPVVFIGYLVALVIAMSWGAVDSVAEFLVFTFIVVVGAVAFLLLGKFARADQPDDH
jgi:hypothetical protein